MINRLKQLARRLPESVQLDLKRRHYARLIRNGRFGPGEPEAEHLGSWVQEGDWVLDVGANIGNYAVLLSRHVGRSGRVICFEPVPTTFALLAANARHFPHDNVSLINAALSNQAGGVGMVLPDEFGSAKEYYARIDGSTGPPDYTVLAMRLDRGALGANRLTLVKVDVEGHERSTLEGMLGLIEEHRPRLIVEGDDPAVAELLDPLGYTGHRLHGSPNTVFTAEVD